MKLNDYRAFDDAILSGILGFAVIFMALKDTIEPINQHTLSTLVLVYLLASISRIFSIILESEGLTGVCIHYCRLILVPYTIWATLRIVFTELGFVSLGAVVPYYVLILTAFYILDVCYGLTVEIRSPILVIFDKNKSKKRS